MRVRFWSNCGFPEAETILGERGVLRPTCLGELGSRGAAASSPPGSLSGDAASRPGTADSVIDIARSLLELSQRNDEWIKRLMDVRASAQDLEDPPVEGASGSLGRISLRS